MTRDTMSFHFRWLLSLSRGLVYEQLVVCRSTLD